MRVNDDVEKMFDKINAMLRSKDFSELDRFLEMRDNLFDEIATDIKPPLRRIQEGGEGNVTRVGGLDFNIVA